MSVELLEDRFGRDLAFLTVGWLTAMVVATLFLVAVGPMVYGI